MGLPYYKRFPRDFLEGTIGLSFEEKGAYAIILDLIYMRDGGLPDDARYISGQLGCSVRMWTKIKSSLIEKGKISVKDGIISFLEYKIFFDRQRSPMARDLRLSVFDRDGYTCQYCEDVEGPFEIDHVYPVSRGGQDIMDNLVCSCRTCNRSKGAKLLSEWVRQ